MLSLATLMTILRKDSSSAGKRDLLMPSQLYCHGGVLLTLGEPCQWAVRGLKLR